MKNKEKRIKAYHHKKKPKHQFIKNAVREGKRYKQTTKTSENN